MPQEYPDGAELQGVFRARLKGQAKWWVWFRGTVKYRLTTSGNQGELLLKIAWQALPETGEKAEASNFELWDDRPFQECPLPLRTPENQVAPGNVWRGDMPAAWLDEANTPEEQWVLAAISCKLRLGQ